MSNLNQVWQKFFNERTANLFERFPGWYRALVVETNDPLQVYRIRYKCPELHDFNLKPEDCPWAMPAPNMGGKDAGSWISPCIGDIIWITWEKNHPYGPLWVGAADPSRRKRYPLESIFTKSPKAVKEDGSPDDKPEDFIKEYLPKDFRPMSWGNKDRYGNVEIRSAIGFFPDEHDLKPAPVGQDAISKSDFDKGDKPEINKPDRKFIADMTKYGFYNLSSDVGYYWKKDEDGDFGEFKGKFDEDHEFEIKRYKYLTKLFNENEPNSEDRDQRRYEIRTRAGHKFEMRDVGWAQDGGGRSGCEDIGPTKSREDEYDTPRILSKWKKSDERWLKWRTKGGHLIQMMDAGFHPEEDNFYKRKLLEECGPDIDGEREGKWTERDARQIRIVTRHGFKFVLDDRGSDPKKAEEEESPHGNGWLFKSRRGYESNTSSTTTSRGFAIEANDKPELNTTRWYTPKSKIIEMNDNLDYMMMCTDVKDDIAPEWENLNENEFARKVAMVEDPEKDTYHLKLDKANGYLRLKTAAGGDNSRRFKPGGLLPAEEGLNQGIESRDGRIGDNGAWTELVDIEHRGMWFSKKEKLGIWRSKTDKDQFIMINDGNNTIIIRNNEDGPMQFYCFGDIEIISEQNIALKAGNRITFKAGTDISFESGGQGHAQLTPNAWNMDVPDNAPRHNGFLPGAASGDGAQEDAGASSTPIDPEQVIQDTIEPKDRGVVGNGPFEEVDEKVITGCDE